MVIANRFAAYTELTKPRITWLILLSTAIGFYFGLLEQRSLGDYRTIEGARLWWALFHTMLGTGLLASGTAALNQWYEWDCDAKMRRTEGRPIPSGRTSRGEALVFGVTLATLGFIELLCWVNVLTALAGLTTLVTYLMIYTPLKRRTPQATTIGAIPGAMPPLIGFAASHGAITPGAWALYAILFVWQFPHFYAIAWMYRDDYRRAGIRMLPAIERSPLSTALHIVTFLVLLIPVSLLPAWFGMTGHWYVAGAIVLGLGFLLSGWQVLREQTLPRARKVLLASVIYLPVLYGLMVVDHL